MTTRLGKAIELVSKRKNNSRGGREAPLGKSDVAVIHLSLPISRRCGVEARRYGRRTSYPGKCGLSQTTRAESDCFIRLFFDNQLIPSPKSLRLYDKRKTL